MFELNNSIVQNNIDIGGRGFVSNILWTIAALVIKFSISTISYGETYFVVFWKCTCGLRNKRKHYMIRYDTIKVEKKL